MFGWTCFSGLGRLVYYDLLGLGEKHYFPVADRRLPRATQSCSEMYVAVKFVVVQQKGGLYILRETYAYKRKPG